jgi:hypothetical protein
VIDLLHVRPSQALEARQRQAGPCLMATLLRRSSDVRVDPK